MAQEDFLGGIAIDIQTRQETKPNKTTIYMKSGHVTSGCVMVCDMCCACVICGSWKGDDLGVLLDGAGIWNGNGQWTGVLLPL